MVARPREVAPRPRYWESVIESVRAAGLVFGRVGGLGGIGLSKHTVVCSA